MKHVFISLSAILFFLCTISFGADVFASSDPDTNLLATVQGISLPAATSSVNYSDGFVLSSPVGVLYQNGGRLSIEHDQNDSDRANHTNFEGGYAGESTGAAVGYSKRCSNCDAVWSGQVGTSFGATGVGVSYHEGLLGLGAIYGIKADHRFGLMLGLDEGNSRTGQLNSYGIGYSYVQPVYSLTLDMSKRDGSVSAIGNTIVTPGLVFKLANVQLSVNDKIYLNSDNVIYYDRAWFGLGFQHKEAWHLAAYTDYVNDLSLVASLEF